MLYLSRRDILMALGALTAGAAIQESASYLPGMATARQLQNQTRRGMAYQ